MSKLPTPREWLQQDAFARRWLPEEKAGEPEPGSTCMATSASTSSIPSPSRKILAVLGAVSPLAASLARHAHAASLGNLGNRREEVDATMLQPPHGRQIEGLASGRSSSTSASHPRSAYANASSTSSSRPSVCSTPTSSSRPTSSLLYSASGGSLQYPPGGSMQFRPGGPQYPPVCGGSLQYPPGGSMQFRPGGRVVGGDGPLVAPGTPGIAWRRTSAAVSPTRASVANPPIFGGFRPPPMTGCIVAPVRREQSPLPLPVSAGCIVAPVRREQSPPPLRVSADCIVAPVRREQSPPPLPASVQLPTAIGAPAQPQQQPQQQQRSPAIGQSPLTGWLDVIPSLPRFTSTQRHRSAGVQRLVSEMEFSRGDVRPPRQSSRCDVRLASVTLT